MINLQRLSLMLKVLSSSLISFPILFIEFNCKNVVGQCFAETVRTHAVSFLFAINRQYFGKYISLAFAPASLSKSYSL